MGSIINREETESSASSRSHNPKGVLKAIGAMAVILPVIGSLLGVVTTYIKDSREESDQNFREVTEKLVLGSDAERLAAATSTGTFIKEGSFWEDDYHDEAINILVNRISSETDYRVLGAIRSSLEEINDNEIPAVIKRILKLDRNIFNYQHSYNLWKEDVEKENSRLISLIEEYSSNSSETNKLSLKELQQQVTLNHDLLSKISGELLLMKTHRNLVSNFLGSYLTLSYEHPISGLGLYQNSLNNARLMRIKIPGANIELSSISSTTVKDADFSNSTIIGSYINNSEIRTTDFSRSVFKDTLFKGKYSKIIDSNFSNTQFKDVFFYGAQLINTDFRGSVGLEPYYFYGAQWQTATFDEPFRQRLENELAEMTFEEFRSKVQSSALSSDKREELLGP